MGLLKLLWIVDLLRILLLLLSLHGLHQVEVVLHGLVVTPVLLHELWVLSVRVSHILKVYNVGIVLLAHLLVGVVLDNKWSERLLILHLPFLKPVLVKLAILGVELGLNIFHRLTRACSALWTERSSLCTSKMILQLLRKHSNLAGVEVFMTSFFTFPFLIICILNLRIKRFDLV